MDSLPEESREFLEEYIDSIHSGDAASQLKKMLEGIAGSSGLSSATVSAIGIRVVAILWALQSQKWDLCGMSLAEIGRRIGKTKADVSHWVKRNERDFGIHARGQKMVESSKTYRKSAKEGWETRRGKNPDKITEYQRNIELLKMVEEKRKQLTNHDQCN